MTQIGLSQFCSKDKCRPMLCKPFSRAGYTWATNGALLVRVQLREDVPDNPAAPNAERLMTAHDGCTFAALPVIAWPPAPDAVDCSACEGRGTEHDCPACTCDCIMCDGNGKATIKRSVKIRGIVFDVGFVQLISGLPEFEFTEKPKDRHPAPFRFVGGIGLLMPMHGEGSLHLGDIEKLPRVTS